MVWHSLPESVKHVHHPNLCHSYAYKIAGCFLYSSELNDNTGHFDRSGVNSSWFANSRENLLHQLMISTSGYSFICLRMLGITQTPTWHVWSGGAWTRFNTFMGNSNNNIV